MAEWIMKEEMDMDGVNCYIRKGELIRCKDCKYYRIYKNADWTVELCGRFRTTMADPVKEDDYCSKAERKDT